MFPVCRSFGHCIVGSCLGSVSAVCAHCWTAASESEASMPPAEVSPAQMLMIPRKGGITHSQRASDMDSLPRWLSGKESACQTGDAGLKSLGQEDPLEEETAILSSCYEESHGQRNPAGYSPWDLRESYQT